MNQNLSRIVTDLFVRSKGNDDLPAKIQRLRAEIKKTVENEDTLYGKFRGLLASFHDIMPDEKQRYVAAVKALSTTSKRSQQEIARAIAGQLEELKILEKGLTPACAGCRDELKTMRARAKETRDEIEKLQIRIEQLEKEEQGLLGGMAAREKEVEIVEKTLKELFADIGAEITLLSKKVDEFTGERAPVKPPAQAVPAKTPAPAGKKSVVEKNVDLQEPATAPLDPKTQKKCPMCGGLMNLHSTEKMWMCYSCAHEEPMEDKTPAAREVGNIRAGTSWAAPKAEPEPADSSHDDDPWSSMSVGDRQRTKKDPSESLQAPKTKTCPVCRKNMDWHPMEQAWRCLHCNYMRRI